MLRQGTIVLLFCLLGAAPAGAQIEQQKISATQGNFQGTLADNAFNPPPIIAEVEPQYNENVFSSLPQVGTEIRVSATITDNTSVANASLSFRRAGDPSFFL